MKQKNTPDLKVPKRTFGNTGVKISKLCLGGGSFGGKNSQSLLDEALALGVDCWEIVSFTGKIYGEFFEKHPEIREKVFLSGKVYSTDTTVMQAQLETVLRENKTSYIDFLALHPVDDIKALNKDVRNWVKKVKNEKKIRFFGFCTHKNMESCLSDASELGWIDGIQTCYNYRMQSIKSMEAAMQKCHEKGIGLFAVKSMGLTVQTEAELQKLLCREKTVSLLKDLNASFEQIKLRAIWQNANLTSICSLMPDSAILHSNTSAAMDEHPLNPETVKLLEDYANRTGTYFCRRCGACETAIAEKLPVFDMMELLMYSRGYGKSDWAAQRFAQMPSEIQRKIAIGDYSKAEKICPQKMPITQLMQEACSEFQRDQRDQRE